MTNGPTTSRSTGWLNPKNQFEMVNGKVVEYKKIVVHEFFVNDEDVVIAAGEQLWQWESSEAGQWVMSHAVEQPAWHKYETPARFGAKIYIVAKMTYKDITFWQLKWGTVDN